MNRSKIEWCDHTLNIITGCRHGCEYCYARKISQRFCGNVKLNKKMKDKYREDEGGYILDEPFIGENGGNGQVGTDGGIERYLFHGEERFPAYGYQT